MSRLKKFWIIFLSFWPFAAGAVAPALVGLIAGGVGIIGVSIWRNVSPVDMAGALNFFSSCWTCQLFSEIMSVISDIVPRVYNAVGYIILPVAASLVGVWFAWRLFSGFINAKPEDPWNLTGDFANVFIKLGLVSALVLAPVPRMLTDVVIEPIFNVGLSMNHIVGDTERFNQCVVATAIADTVTIDARSAGRGAFSPKLRHNLACDVAGIHQMTGLGMTVGWTMLNMAFNRDYMHKIMWGIPIFPNVPLIFAGGLILVLFFMALLPVPVYFLEIFITLALDLIMLPLMLLSWLFKDWKIFPSGTKNIRGIIDRVVQGTLGIAATGVLLTFMLIFLNAIAGGWTELNVLQSAIEQNDSHILMDGLMMNNTTLVTVILVGIFFAMFMTMIPTIIKTFFNIQVSDNFYKTITQNAKILWNKVTVMRGKFNKSVFNSNAVYN